MLYTLDSNPIPPKSQNCPVGLKRRDGSIELAAVGHIKSPQKLPSVFCTHYPFSQG